MCEVVTRYFSIRSSVPSGVHLSIRTTVCPRCSESAANVSTAVWYSGDTTRCTLSF
jgi:hypothetical protein